MVLSMSRPWNHPKTGVYYYRKVVPEAMRKLVGKVEVRQTMGTKDPREAARKFTEVAAKVAAEWEALRRGPVMADLARNFVQHLGPDGRAALADDLLEVDLKSAGVLDERELPDEWELELELPALVDGLGLRRACLGHRVSFRIRWAKDSPGPSGGVRDCRSLR
jgi:hypothetical protein